MLFSVDQRYYIVMWCWSAQIYKHARYQLVRCMNWRDSLDYKIFWKLALPGKIFLKAYFAINDFSDIVLELAPPDTLEFLKTGHEWVLGLSRYLLELHIQI